VNNAKRLKEARVLHQLHILGQYPVHNRKL